MIKFIKEENINVLDIPAFDKLRSEKSEYIVKKSDDKAKKNYYKSVKDFFQWYISYCDSVIKKNYSDDNISETIFLLDFKNEAHWKEYIIKCVYVSRDYVKHLNNEITENNISIYEHTLSSLTIDLEWLIAQYEIFCKKSIDSISLNSGRRTNLSPTDLYSAARTLFYIEEFTKIEDLYLRDLKPAVMFQIRQLLEVYGRNIIGYYSITSNGLPIKKFTQISWEFIKDECKKNNTRIKLPFKIDIITSLNTWANDFVHTTYIHNSYIQFFALKILKALFNSTTKGIIDYNGNTIQKLYISDITIDNYNSLKVDFENFLNARQPGIEVNWMSVDKVGAYIISL